MNFVISCFHNFFQTVSQNLCQYVTSNKPIQTGPKSWNVAFFSLLMLGFVSVLIVLYFMYILYNFLVIGTSKRVGKVRGSG